METDRCVPCSNSKYVDHRNRQTLRCAFHSRGFAGTQFVYPADFLHCIAAKAEFNLALGEVRIVSRRWQACLEDNNLAYQYVTYSQPQTNLMKMAWGMARLIHFARLFVR